jgi:DNA-binding transcriptional ArsR family regulator
VSVPPSASPQASPLVARLEELLGGGPVFFHEVLEAMGDQSYRSVLNAWSDLREAQALDRDERGRYRLGPPSKFG